MLWRLFMYHTSLFEKFLLAPNFGVFDVFRMAKILFDVFYII